MKKLRKYIAVRLIALLMFPYSASAAAACNTQLDYSADTGPDFAYESAAYRIDEPKQVKACANTPGTALEAQTSGADLPSMSGINDLAL